ncbi:hypothetical protein FV226_25750 [Methylobacterium sp. WL12]|uniref:hypothetical protein n=1 Tax=Methylobacterium sp. WL12 TaxID=2603890 RepID=UPI0011C851F8|nr:hypothetical protein [Methylobacterium sp. WL12]TXM64957.1 hypothetical protein FV226_25750 [Methylobacterium sp. WL12]
MRIRGFLHSDEHKKTTLSQIKDLRSRVLPQDALLCFAYATNSGAAQYDMSMGSTFWNDVTTRWLFGIDYGRTHPQALRFIAGKANTSVKVFDGSYVVEADRFIPRRDFHMKTSFFRNAPTEKYGMVSGSGNFSSGGLIRNIECGISLFAASKDHFRRTFRPSYIDARSLWDNATPLADIIDRYEVLWKKNYEPPPKAEEADEDLDPVDFDIFWTEAGYVTRNRGDDKPGNQIDLPWLVHRYFGFSTPAAKVKNSTFGEITYLTPTGGPITRNYRYGNNSMEKMTLPIPEQTGLDIYDGKVIVFQKGKGGFTIRLLEIEDFDRSFRDRLVGTHIMGSGRRYGFIH